MANGGPVGARRRRRAGQTSAYLLVGLLIVGILLVAIMLRARTRDVTVTSSPGAAAPPNPAAAVTGPQLAPPGGGGGGAALPRLTRHQPPYDPGYKGCPPEGDGGDPALNRLKNRADSAAWMPATVDAVLALQWPRAIERRPRREWSDADSTTVAANEGTPVAVEGYFAGGKQEGPESPNCHGADADFRDWHLWLSATPGRDRTRSVVVETTPVVRANHPEWTLEAIRALARDSARVRVSGWLMLDPEHPDQVGKTRGTIWEIHPILGIAVERDGAWVPLDSSFVPRRSRRRRR